MKNIRNIIELKYPPQNTKDLWLKDGKLYHSTSQGWVPLSEEPSITETYEQGVSSISYSGKDGQEHQIELSENVESDVTDIINDTFVTDEDNNVTFTDNNDTEHTLVTTDAFQSILANNSMLEVTWLLLKDKRDNSQLIAGSLYRITDYNCTTTQENTRSAGHQFDIVLLALSANKLAEEGWAMMNENIYDVTFGDNVTLKCYVNLIGDGNGSDTIIVRTDTMLGGNGLDRTGYIIDETNKTASFPNINSTELTDTVAELASAGIYYNYFQNSNLSAWKVWYCLDNDTDRFAWTDNSVDEGSPANIVFGSERFVAIRNANQDIENYYCWIEEGLEELPYYTEKEIPDVGDTIYQSDHGMIQPINMEVEVYNPPHEGTGLPNGRGVIYRLIDEHNNDCPYDFKNIQYIRKLTDGEYDAQGTDTWVYTFNGWDEDNDVVFDLSLTFENANNNFVGSPLPDSFALADVVFIGSSSSSSSSSSSGNCTLNNTAYVRLVGCEGAIINAPYSDYLYCNDTLVTTDADDPAIYFNNKKVLTET